MKTAALALVGLLGSATASVHNHQKRHAELHERGAAALATGASNDSECGCTTYTTWFYGAPTLISASAPPASSAVSVAAVVPSSSAAPVKPSSSSAAPVLPTPGVQTMPTPGTYTIPATTITVSETTTVCGASSTALTSGTNTVGGVTTVVSTATTVVCPYATTEAKGSDVTSIIKTTTYVCPSAGTYTIGAITTSVSTSTGIVYPVPATFTPGTYTKPEQTITVTETDYVYVCPFTSSGVIPPPSSAPAAPAAPAVTTSAAPAPPAVTITSSVVPVVSSAPASPVVQSSSAVASSVASSSAKASSTPAAGNIVTNGNQWAMTYTPYSQSGNCKTASEVSADIALIKSKGFTTVRLYATDCDALSNVGGAVKSNGMKIIIGIFIDGSGISAAQEQVSAIQQWGSSGNWDMVVMIVVGNEAVFNGYCTAEALAAFISSVKSTVSGAGFTGPVTTTEPLNVLQKSAGALCGVLDVVAANIQPFFNAAVTAESAGQFVSDSIDAIAAVCPGKEAYNLECGWPTQGSPNGAAVPGVSEQQAALSGILAKAGTRSVIFSFENDLWKADGEFSVEKYWGCAKNFATS